MAKEKNSTQPTETISFPPQSVDNPPPESISDMKKALSSFLAARVELASLEAKEAAQFAVKKLSHLAILAISGFFLWALVLAGLTGVLAPFATQWLGDKVPYIPGWCLVLFALALIHAVVVVICISLLKKKPSEELFSLSRQELENDKKWLGKNK